MLFVFLAKLACLQIPFVKRLGGTNRRDISFGTSSVSILM